MLLDLKIKNFATPPMAVDAAAVAAFEQRTPSPLVALASYLKGKDTLLDADTVQKHLFPSVKADVFLSHASGDRQQVMQLAVALERLGLTVFVDSCVWGNVYALLNDVDDHFSRKKDEPGSYHYRKVTRTAANVYMILSAALQRMIDGCELFLYLDSPAVRIKDYVDGGDYIGSPWVFSELMFARHVARRGRPRPSLEVYNEGAGIKAADSTERMARFLPPASTHALEWKVLARAMEDMAGLPASARWRDGPWFLDHLYRKLSLSAQERQLLGWPPAS